MASLNPSIRHVRSTLPDPFLRAYSPVVSPVPDPPWTPSAQKSLRAEIAASGGNEVYFLARMDEAGRIFWAEPMARGGPDSVPAPQLRPQSGEAVVHNHPGGNLQPSEPDLEIASQLGARGVGFFIIDSEVTRIYRVVEPFQEADAPPPDIEALRGTFSPGGGLARAFSGFEPREEQGRMAEMLTNTFELKGIAVVEAGTGVGKSLAYLVPALDWARRHGKRVAISTATHTLQQQLVENDIPLLEKATGAPVRAATLMGRSNYVCKRKAAELSRQETLELDDEASDAVRELARWASATPTGERRDFGSSVSETVWEKVASMTDQTLRTKCPFYNECFYYQARRKAASSELLIVNHHLLLSDLALKTELDQFSDAAVLPPFEAVVIDEAHHLPDTGTTAASTTLSATRMAKVCQRLVSSKDPLKGLLAQFETRINRSSEPGEPRVALLKAAGEVRGQVIRVRDTGRKVFDQWFDTFDGMLPSGERGGRYRKLRITRRECSLPSYGESVETPARELMTELVRLAGLLEALTRSVKGDSPLGKETEANLVEMRSLQGRLELAAEDLAILLTDDDEYCTWVDLDADNHRVTLHRAPVDPGPFLDKAIFSQPSVEAVALTSATLAVAGKFANFERQSGLIRSRQPERRTELLLTSPFDFARQAMLATPGDIPDPKSDLFALKLANWLRELLLASRGHAFVLFTSYQLLERTFRELEPVLSAAGLTALRQEAGRKGRLADQFRNSAKPVLFATASFWEGVDIPGDQLRHVIITRLPFTVPSEPIQVARAERIRKEGRSDFDEMSVPQAVIRFRQGFGRLIRSKTDRGVVTVLDSRIVTKRFGRVFTDSLPPVRRSSGKWEQVISDVRDFFRTFPDE